MNTNKNFKVMVGTVKKFYKRECQEEISPRRAESLAEVGWHSAPELDMGVGGVCASHAEGSLGTERTVNSLSLLLGRVRQNGPEPSRARR